jgi:predicted nucleic acid-binding protein
VIVVSDTSPLLYLSRLGHLGLLQRLYGDVVVPRTVWQELVERRPQAPGVEDLRGATWIRVDDRAEATAAFTELLLLVDPGEAAAIVLAELLTAELLLVDDRKGWRAARARGIGTLGTIGVLVEARKRELVLELRPVFDALLREGFRADAALIRRALEAVGESP